MNRKTVFAFFSYRNKLIFVFCHLRVKIACFFVHFFLFHYFVLHLVDPKKENKNSFFVLFYDKQFIWLVILYVCTVCVCFFIVYRFVFLFLMTFFGGYF